MPSEELLDSEGKNWRRNWRLVLPSHLQGVGLRRGFHRFAFRTLSALRGAHCPDPGKRIDSWCVQRGYKDYSINFMTLSRSPQHLQGRSGRLFLPAPAHHVSGVAERYSFSRCTEHDAGAPPLQQRRDLCRVWFLLAHAALPHLQGERGMYANCLARTPVATGPLGAMKPSFWTFLTLFKAFCGCLLPTKATPASFQCNTYLVGMQHICAWKIHPFSSENPNFAAWTEWINLQHCLKAMSNSTSVSA